MQQEDQHVQNAPSRLAVAANDNNNSHKTGRELEQGGEGWQEEGEQHYIL